ncbi:MAG: nucleotidyltransferase domain-containing protein [Planctomycetota bacterium]
MGTIEIADAGLLGQTLFSRNRRAVLGLLLGHPDEQFYLRQIVRFSGGGVGAIQRELKQLTEAGLLRRTVRGNQVYFQASADCPVFEEMKSILAKTAGAADILRAALAPLVDKISVAFIYGSVARSQQRAASDVDLLVIGDAAFGEVVAALAEAQAQLHREVNPTVYPLREFSTKINAGHHFVKSILKREKIFLIGDDRELKRLAEKRVADRT